MLSKVVDYTFCWKWLSFFCKSNGLNVMTQSISFKIGWTWFVSNANPAVPMNKNSYWKEVTSFYKSNLISKWWRHHQPRNYSKLNVQFLSTLLSKVAKQNSSQDGVTTSFSKSYDQIVIMLSVTLKLSKCKTNFLLIMIFELGDQSLYWKKFILFFSKPRDYNMMTLLLTFKTVWA